MALSVINKRFDDSGLPHKLLRTAVAAALDSAPTSEPFVSFNDVARVVPGLDEGVFHQIVLDLGYTVVTGDPEVKVVEPAPDVKTGAPGVATLMAAVSETTPKLGVLARVANMFRA